MFTDDQTGVFTKVEVEPRGLTSTILATIPNVTITTEHDKTLNQLTINFSRALTDDEKAAAEAVAGGHNPALLTEKAHEGLKPLSHWPAVNGFTEIFRAVNGSVERVTIWRSPSMTRRLRETLITRTASKVSSMVVTDYDENDSPLSSFLQTFNRGVGSKVESITTEI